MATFLRVLVILVVALSVRAFGATGASSAPVAAKTIGKAEADKLIDQAGRTPPAWWNSTALNYPSTLDLSWKKVGKWDNQRQMDGFLWDIIYPNPARWHEGVKLAMHSISVNKGNEAVMKKSAGALADMYTRMLQDYARGAYWAKKAGGMEFTLAECYAKLGARKAATDLMNQVGQDETFDAVSVKLWSDMGDLRTALLWADDIAEEGRDSTAYLAAGDACRRVGDVPKAMEYYQKVLASHEKNSARNKKRAQMNMEAIKLFEALDLQKVPDGLFKSTVPAYTGPLTVGVTVKGHVIEKVEVVEHHEKQFYASVTEVPPQIVAKQSVKGIDATTGATITSEAIINASAKALSAAQK